jgi:hypothetical protein
MIPKRCKSCQFFEELLAEMNTEGDFIDYPKPIRSCTISKDCRFHFNCDEYVEYEE